MVSRKITIIKLGGSVITDKTKPYTPLFRNIRQLTKEIKHIQTPLILVHGSGSFGHTSATLYGGNKGYISKKGIAKVSYDAMHINQIVMEILLQEGLPVIAVHPRSMLLTENGFLKLHRFEIVTHLLSQNLIPVSFGDVLWDRGWKSTIFSGEKLIVELIAYMHKQKAVIDKVIFIGDTDGVYDTYGRTIPIITKNKKASKRDMRLFPVPNDVTGGMKHKVELSLQIAAMNVPVSIVNGLRPKELVNAYLGKPTYGTTIQ